MEKFKTDADRQETLKKEFLRHFNWQMNFVTPEPLRYYQNKDKNCMVELSRGRGIYTPYLYGVTVIVNGEKAKSECEVFDRQDKALYYIGEILERNRYSSQHN